ncbi:hypothetical protein GY45DRAFT_1327895 [Cubamyces sp. BRFM 1775]|nr:hypothetical protein GY45DRAFT_1327895 [Cubamyces sp. BRFM 1775]
MPELNWDVLASICGRVRDVPTILSMTLTCRTLHIIAVKRLLETQVVTLKDTRSILSFHHFINADRTTRLPFVRKLKIDILSERIDEDSRSEAVQSLLDILQQSTYLDSLALPHPNSTYRALGCDPRFPEIVARLSTLRDLALERWWAPIEEILTHTFSPLRALRISLDGLPGDAPLTPDRLYSLLQRVSPTLEVLQILGKAVSFVDRQRNDVTFPAMRSFEVAESCQLDWIWTADLVRMFPALDGTLAFEGLYYLFNGGVGRIHRENRESQLQKTWTCLERVIGDIEIVYSLGLVCPVRHLMLDRVCEHTKDWLGDILHNTFPTHVKLSIDLSHGMHILDDLLPPAIFPRLTHLILVFTFCDYTSLLDNSILADMQTTQWSAFLTEIITALEETRLTHLRIVLQCSMDQRNYMSRPYSKELVSAVRDLGEGPEALAVKFISTFPTLRYVFLMTTGDSNDDYVPPGVSPPAHDSGDYSYLVRQGQWLSSSGWRNVVGTPERLASDVMEELIEAEDLFLTKKDHVSDVCQHSVGILRAIGHPTDRFSFVC